MQVTSARCSSEVLRYACHALHTVRGPRGRQIIAWPTARGFSHHVWHDCWSDARDLAQLCSRIDTMPAARVNQPPPQADDSAGKQARETLRKIYLSHLVDKGNPNPHIPDSTLAEIKSILGLTQGQEVNPPAPAAKKQGRGGENSDVPPAKKAKKAK